MLTAASRAMYATMASGIFLSALAVLLRVYARRLKGIPLKFDDYLIMGAWFFSALLAVTNIVGVPVGGFGMPFETLGHTKALTFLKILFILQFWYIIAVGLVKLSVISLYGRIFSVAKYPLSLAILFYIVLGWTVSFVFATFFQIWPLDCNWRDCAPRPPWSNYPVMYLCSSATDLVIDILILGMPALFMRKLQMSRGRKVGLVGIFGLGIFCVVSSVARLVATTQFEETDKVGDYAVNFDTAVVNIIMWSGIEACASTICACLPCYMSLFTHGRPTLFSAGYVRSLLPYGSKKSDGSKTTRNSNSGSGRVAWLESKDVEGGEEVETDVSRGGEGRIGGPQTGNVVVRTKVEYGEGAA